MALERLTQITEVGIQSGITLRNVNIEGAYVSGVVTATSLNITGGGANFVGVVTATSFNGNVNGNITPTGLVVSGVSTFQSSSFWGDGDVAYFGDGQDLLIFHNSTDSIIRDNGTGDLYIEGGNRIRLTNPTAIETYAVFNQDGASELYYDNVKRLETSGIGVSVTGSVIASGISTFSSGVVVSAGSTSAPSISPTGDSNTGIFFPSADTIAIAEGGVEALRINSSGNLGIGTTNPTTTLQVNGTTKVETSIGSTQSVWFDTLDSKSLSANNVSLLVQPENAYFHNSSLSSRDYYPVVVSTALTTNNVSNFGALYGITNLANVAGTASTARVYGVGSYNFLARNSTTDVSSYASNQLYGQLNNVVQGTNVDASVVTGFAINFTNQTIIQKGTATNIIGNYQVISVGNVPNNSANSTSAFNFSAFSVAGASSGTGIGTITDLYSYYANALILSTGRVSNYYGLYLNSPSVFGGTLSNRYSIFSNDASSPMYHAGSIGIGITNPGAKLHVSGGNIKVDSGYGIDFSATANAAGMTSELLADYEEGTWTPTFGVESGSISITYATQTGRYTKIGNTLFITFEISWSARSGTGNILYITGAPYAAIGNNYQGGLTRAYGLTFQTWGGTTEVQAAVGSYNANSLNFQYFSSATTNTDQRSRLTNLIAGSGLVTGYAMAFI